MANCRKSHLFFVSQDRTHAVGKKTAIFYSVLLMFTCVYMRPHKYTNNISMFIRKSFLAIRTVPRIICWYSIIVFIWLRQSRHAICKSRTYFYFFSSNPIFAERGTVKVSLSHAMIQSCAAHACSFIISIIAIAHHKHSLNLTTWLFSWIYFEIVRVWFLLVFIAQQ